MMIKSSHTKLDESYIYRNETKTLVPRAVASGWKEWGFKSWPDKKVFILNQGKNEHAEHDYFKSCLSVCQR